jgi:DNA invertase Pin-like site-specific DNA recombinase
MSNSETIKKFIEDKGVSQKKICDVIKISAKTLYTIINSPGPRGISDENKEKLNKMFKSYNYDGKIN